MKLPKKRSVIMMTGIASLVAVILSYQNCSDTLLIPQQKLVIGSSIPDSMLCTRAADLFSNQLKVLFVVDMSLSNIGMLNGGTLNPAGATDPGVPPGGIGLRFQKMIDFINGCGSTNTNNKFAVAGFSGPAFKALVPQGVCPQSFVSQTAAVQKVQDLAAVQTADQARPTGPYTMQNTTYLDGLNCANATVSADINANPTAALNTTYLVFFLTDGKPTDNCDVTNPGNINNYGSCYITTSNPSYETTIVNMMIMGKSKASNIRLQPIYYGPASEQATALQILDFFAHLGDSKQTILIQNAANFDFCTAANEPVNTTFHMSEFNVINLTSIMRAKSLQPDSDMDGVIDSEDANPRNARSNPAQLLDGICAINGGPSYCQRPAGCSMSNVTRMHMTNCDLSASQLTDGLDTDLDRIPDLIEIVRATDPIIDDAFDNLDNDNGTNIVELHNGRQVDYADDDVNSSYLTKWKKSIQAPSASCPQNQENWKFSISQVPLLSTLDYTDPMDALFPGSKFSLSHAAGENLIFVYYYIEPDNASAATVARELWGTVIKVSASNPNPQLSLQSSDFQKLGLVTGVQP